MNFKYILRIWGLFLLFFALLMLPFYLPMLQGEAGASWPQPFIFYGLLSYAFMAFDIILGSRFAFFERGHGLPENYFHHGLLGFGATISAVIHIIYSIIRENHTFDLSLTQFIGYLAMQLLIAVIFSGMFMISSEFIRRFPRLMHYKERVFHREVGLFMHRMAYPAALFMFWHTMLTRSAQNPTFRTVFILSFVLTTLAYLASKIKRILAPKYRLTAVETFPGRCYHLFFEPIGRRRIRYHAGQYVFVRFIDALLPRESHPYSFTSCPMPGENGFSIMIKESGDYTDRIDKLRVGDTAKIEGAYGTFLYKEKKTNTSPLLLIGGGVGVTPMISILRAKLAENSPRDVVLIWGLNRRDEVYFEDMFADLAAQHPKFRYFILLANEQADGYEHGFVDRDFFERTGLTDRMSDGEFYLCGPVVMMDSVTKTLKDFSVKKAKIHAERFTF